MALDASFLDEPTTKAAKKPEESFPDSGLDVSFLDEGPKNAEKLPHGFFQKLKDAVTGESRQTEATQGLPEFDIPLIDKDAGIGENINRQGRLFSTALGLMTSFSPERQAKTLQNNFPDLVFEEDEKGNIIVDGSAYGGGRGVMNMPGVSPRDLIQAGFQVALFAPAGGASALGSGALSRAASVGVASGATQAGQDLVSQATGGDVSLKEIDKSDVALVAGSGAIFEGLFTALGRAIPAIRKKYETSGVTNDIRRQFKDAAAKSGINPNEVSDDVIDSFLKASVDAVTPDETAAIAGEREFGVQLTKGTRSGNKAQITFEDNARSGRFGNRAQEVMEKADISRNEQILSASRRLQARLGGEFIENQSQAGGALKQSARGAEEAARAAVDEAFEQVGDAALSVVGMKKLLLSSRKAIQGVEFDKTLPETEKILSGIKKTERAIKSFEGKGLKPFHIQRLEQMRRRIDTGIGSAQGPDKRQLIILQRAWDQYLDEAVKKALFEGDQESLNALKSSRRIFSEYAKKFRSQRQRTRSGRNIPDKTGSFIESIIESDPTDIQVVNSIFGAGDTFGNTAGARYAQKVKGIVSEEAWDSLRQAAYIRLIKVSPDGKTISGRNTRNAINNALSKNKELMEVLFTPEEIGTMKRFSAFLVKAQPDKVNPSGTSDALISTLRYTVPKIGFLLGHPIIAVTAAGAVVTPSFRAASRAKAATKPFASIVSPKGEIVGAAVGATASGLTTLDE